jgi:dipeptidyl aminopeptidase/acylaminoacyl peptidase
MPDALTDLDAFLALPRLSGLVLSPDGNRLVTTVATLDPKRTKHLGALWEIDPTGDQPARRLTRSHKGESAAMFTRDGSLLFTSARPDPDREDDDDTPAAVWRLPTVGEARIVGTRPGGIAALVVAKEGRTVLVVSDTMPGSTDDADDERRRKERKDRKVTAVLHSGYPVRYWDADLGVGQPRLLAGELDPEGCVAWRDLTPQPGRALQNAEVDLTPDGRTAVTTWSVAEPRGSRRTTLVAVDTTTGERRVLTDDGSSDHAEPRVSPDGTRVAFTVELRSSPTEPVDMRLVVAPLDGSASPRDVAPAWDRWADGHRWTPDGRALIVGADEAGRRPVFRIELSTGEVTRLTGDDGHYSDVQVSPDGGAVYAMRDAVDAPPAPVRLDAHAADQLPTPLRGPEVQLTLPGRVEEVTATAADGTALRSWLVVPAGEGPHPLLLWVHGGPLSSWNGWSWRWNPWLMAARGYAVLLPDPALSTGYGLDFVRRGWGRWGDAPYTDLMALTDAALERSDLDGDHTAVMGGSFGGYMANWIAGQTARFRAIVTHASLWDLEQFSATTDTPHFWKLMMTAEMAAAHSPSRHADAIRTPMLVVHGDKDYRVPIGEGLRLWWDLVSRSDDTDLPHRFLYFPDENHWVLAPQHTVLWYETVLAFLAVHVHGEPWRTPELLA